MTSQVFPVIDRKTNFSSHIERSKLNHHILIFWRLQGDVLPFFKLLVLHGFLKRNKIIFEKGKHFMTLHSKQPVSAMTNFFLRWESNRQNTLVKILRSGGPKLCNFFCELLIHQRTLKIDALKTILIIVDRMGLPRFILLTTTSLPHQLQEQQNIYNNTLLCQNKWTL